MSRYLKEILENIYSTPSMKDIEFVLSLNQQAELSEIYSFADEIRKRYMGDSVFLRGIVEFSNYCRSSCFYCGLNKNNKKLTRYRLTEEEIIDAAKKLFSFGIKTIVLQSGEDENSSAVWLGDIILEIKRRFDLAVTLSVGERKRQDYKLWRDKGADRYLLKIETSNHNLYNSMHPGMSYKSRIRCLNDLRDLGYQVGSGNIIGLRGQAIKDIAADIIFFKNNDFDMIGIGPFIPHQNTEFSTEGKADVSLVLKVIALTRIVTKNTHLPATTALGSLGRDFRIEGLRSGANVLMPNFTPIEYKHLYEIYPNKKCLREAAEDCLGCMQSMVSSVDRVLDCSKGDSFKKKQGMEILECIGHRPATGCI